MFRNIGCSAAIFTTECETLQHAQGDQDDRCENAERGRAGQDTHEERGCAHDDDGDKECVFTTDEIADASEDESAERTDEEACRESKQDEDVSGCFRVFIEEGRADEGCECSVKIEVVPFEDGTKRRRKDHLAFFARHFLRADVGT